MNEGDKVESRKIEKHVLCRASLSWTSSGQEKKIDFPTRSMHIGLRKKKKRGNMCGLCTMFQAHIMEGGVVFIFYREYLPERSTLSSFILNVCCFDISHYRTLVIQKKTRDYGDFFDCHRTHSPDLRTMVITVTNPESMHTILAT